MKSNMWVMTFAVLSLGLLVSASRTVAQDVPRSRSLWVYEGGWFEKRNNGTWIELNRDLYRDVGKAEFVELKRTNQVVELYDASRNMTVRLYDSKMEWKVDAGNEWNFLYDGRWKR